MENEKKQKSAETISCLESKPVQEDTAKKNECPQCCHDSGVGAAFCEECGHSLVVKTPCPYCATPMYGKQHICEFCGEWLLEGQCRYCEADIDSGQLFCSDCGNLLRKLDCPRCGAISGFEICLNCGMPLTVPAKEMCAGQPAILTSMFSTPQDVSKPIESSTVLDPTPLGRSSETLKLKAYREKLSSAPPDFDTAVKHRSPASLFDLSQKDSINRLEQEAVIELQRQAEIQRQEEELKRQELLKKALTARAEGTVYVNSLQATITIKNEDGIADDKFWLWLNNDKVGYVGYQTGERVAFSVNLTSGINLLELRFDEASGVGTVASITITPNDQMYRFGGSCNHMWVVITK